MGYQFLNIFFFVFHTAFTLFNCVGWAFAKARKLHLFTMLLTVFSWFVLGIWYGWGYCACTEWHGQAREALGHQDRSNSYIHFLLLKLTGKNVDPQLVENATLIIFIACFVLNVVFHLIQRRKTANQS
ncbi:MAG: DUF2784 domain-containing protein [Ferruginibacter sp.]|nr:DUF2784 domain-containing protein [Ferruginibacter sp.]